MTGTYGFFSHSHVKYIRSWKKEADLLNDITTSNQILHNTQSQRGQHSAFVYHMPKFIYKE
ncbi:hypothetical protein ACB092_03G035200 [Castanea dentata]